MFKFIKNKENKNKGFTLVELVIVVAILAILVGILAPQYTKYVEKSRKTADLHNLDNIINAIKVGASDQEYQLGSRTNPVTYYDIIIGEIQTGSVKTNEIEIRRSQGDQNYDQIGKVLEEFTGLKFDSTDREISFGQSYDCLKNETIQIKSHKWGEAKNIESWTSVSPFWATDSGIGARVALDNSTGSISVTYTDNVTNYLDHGTVD